MDCLLANLVDHPHVMSRARRLLRASTLHVGKTREMLSGPSTSECQHGCKFCLYGIQGVSWAGVWPAHAISSLTRLLTPACDHTSYWLVICKSPRSAMAPQGSCSPEFAAARKHAITPTSNYPRMSPACAWQKPVAHGGTRVRAGTSARWRRGSARC